MASLIAPADLRSFAQLPPVEVIADSDLQVYIDQANLVRVEDFVGSTLSVGRLDMIELNLAAHFAILTYEKGGVVSEMIGASQDRYRMINDKQYGLASTRFGQTALALDTTGTLSANTTVLPKARFNVI